MEVYTYNWVVDEFTCQGSPWDHYEYPLIISVTVPLGAWLLFVVGFGGLAFAWMWILHSQRYLVLLGNELLFFRTHWLFGEVYRSDVLLVRGESDEGAVITKELRFESTANILLRCRWHARVELNGEGQDNFIHTVALIEDYANAQQIYQWVDGTLP